jgi:hypothetical protein
MAPVAGEGSQIWYLVKCVGRPHVLKGSLADPSQDIFNLRQKISSTAYTHSQLVACTFVTNSEAVIDANGCGLNYTLEDTSYSQFALLSDLVESPPPPFRRQIDNLHNVGTRQGRSRRSRRTRR